MLEDAGRCNVPFTTGILIGIGETPGRTRRLDLRHPQGGPRVPGHPGSHRAELPGQAGHQDARRARRRTRRPGRHDRRHPAASSGAKARIQAPPNLVGDQHDLILRAGIDDWGGVSPLTPDHVNPERPWPAIDELAARTAAAGFTLRERLTIYPPYLREPWLDPRLAAHVAALADPATGLADEAARPRGLPWQEPDGGLAGQRAGAPAAPTCT